MVQNSEQAHKLVLCDMEFRLLFADMQRSLRWKC